MTSFPLRARSGIWSCKSVAALSWPFPSAAQAEKAFLLFADVRRRALSPDVAMFSVPGSATASHVAPRPWPAPMIRCSSQALSRRPRAVAAQRGGPGPSRC